MRSPSSASIMIASGYTSTPEFVVGNSSDVLGEYKLIKIPVTKLRYFPIIAESGKLPVDPEVGDTIERSFLDGTPLATLQDPKVALLNSWLVGFAGNDLPHATSAHRRARPT